MTAGALRLSAAELVPGDVVMLQAGDKVPADMRLTYSRDLRIDESTLTGESVPVEKGRSPSQTTPPLRDRSNMAYASTLATAGQGTGVVVATGDDTEVGRISHLISEAEELKTPLTRKIADFSKLLLFVILGLAVVTAVVGILRGEGAVEMFMAAVALAVGAIPEGLPAAVTITLAIGVSRMAHRRAIIRKLPAVETLGSTTVICSDKTGTLTENQMTVQRIALRGFEYMVTGGGYTPEGSIVDAGRGVADRGRGRFGQPHPRRVVARGRTLQRQLALSRRRPLAHQRGPDRGRPARLGGQGWIEPRGVGPPLPPAGYCAFRVRAPVHGHTARSNR